MFLQGLSGGDRHEILGGKKYKLNHWYRFVLHVRYDITNKGFLELWLDGKKVINIKNHATAYKWSDYKINAPKEKPSSPQQVALLKTHYIQKIGVYYGYHSFDAVVAYDSYRIGDHTSSYNEVSPKGGSLNPEPLLCAPGETKVSSCSIQYASVAKTTKVCNSSRADFTGGSRKVITCFPSNSSYTYLKNASSCIRKVVSRPVNPSPEIKVINIKTGGSVKIYESFKVNVGLRSEVKLVDFYTVNSSGKFDYKGTDKTSPFSLIYKGFNSEGSKSIAIKSENINGKKVFERALIQVLSTP